MAPALRGKVEYAIFDMDGLLSQDQRLKPRAQADMQYQILARYGHTMTWEIKAGLMGKVQHAAAAYLYSHFPGLEDALPVDAYLAERNAMQDDLFRKVPPMAGAVELVNALYDAGVPIALATGSNRRNFDLKTGHLPEIFSRFHPTCILTADSPEVRPGRGKPEPDIFLAAAHKLGRDVGAVESCTDAQRAERAKGLVFEDARPGVLAGVAAGMNVIWVPDPELLALDPGATYGASQVLGSLDEWNAHEWGLKLGKQ